MKDKDVIVTSGGYYRRGPGGWLHPCGAGTPDVHVCRRVVDFPDRKLPAGALLDRCELCGQLVGRQPVKRGPIVCMLCVGIQPLPQTES